MSDFQLVANLEEIEENGMKLVELDDQLVLLVNVNNEIYCIDDVCTHDGGTLCDGKIDGFEIACPRHGAKFERARWQGHQNASHPTNRLT